MTPIYKNALHLYVLWLLIVLGTVPLLANNEKNEFRLLNDRKAELKTLKNVNLFIEPKSFVDADGKFPDVVKIVVIDIIDKASLFKNGIITMNEGHPLLTAGIMDIRAFDEKTGKPLQLANGSRIYVEMPADNPLENIQLGFAKIETDVKGVATAQMQQMRQQEQVPTEWTVSNEKVRIKRPGRLVEVRSHGGKTEAVNEGDTKGVHYGYGFYTTRLGWMMLYAPLETVLSTPLDGTLEVQVDENDMELLLVSTKYNCIISAKNIKGKSHYFTNLPNDEEFAVIGFKMKKSSFMFVKKTVVTRTTVMNINEKLVTQMVTPDFFSYILTTL